MKKNITLVTVTIIALLLNACGGDSSTKKSAIHGKFIDSPVHGAQYKCGKIDNKITQKDGSFFCETYPITFYIGGVKLGEINKLAEDGYVTPQDLVGVERSTYGTKVKNLALFLQSLDDDGNIDTAITIEKKHIEKLHNRHHTIHTMTHNQIVDLLGELDIVNIVSSEEAHEHLRTHVEALPPYKNPVKDNPIKGDPIKNNPVKDHPIKGDPIKDNPVKDNPIKYNPKSL